MSALDGDAPRIAEASRPLSYRRIGAIMLRNYYLFRGSWPRVLELIYWPTLEMVMWGFTSRYMATQSSLVAHAAGIFLGAALLWDVFLRGQLGVSITFLEEVWSRNLGQMFISPLRPAEWVVSLLLLSALRVIVGVLPAALLAIPFYGYSVFSLGPALFAFILELMMMSWGIGICVSAVILLNGPGSEGLAWLATFILAPLSAVYYPVASLPRWLQWVAFVLPSSHVFEGMRAVMFHRRIDYADMTIAYALDVAFLTVGFVLFLRAFAVARRRGALLQTGE
jgi:ABC-2 type transport system permease protein